MSRILVPIALLVACGGQPIPPTAESCAAICKAGEEAPKPAAEAAPAPAPDKATPSGSDGLSAFEQKHVGPVLDDLRGGVRPYDDKSVGLCKGKDECEEFLGLEATDLPPGDYILQAVLAVPALGEDWSMELTTICETTKGNNKSSNENSKTYELKYPGPDRGYNLVPLRRITSPGKHGAQACSYTMTAAHPDGDKVIEGKWSVPG